MAVILNKTYRIKSYAGNGRNLNVYGNEQVSNNRNVCLWSQDSTANAQKWTLKKSSTGYNKLVTALDNSYALNYNWANGQGNAGNCDIYPEANNDTDSAISFNTVDAANNIYKIKLRNYSLYLTAASNSDGANVTWEANNSTTAQQWKLVEVDETATRKVIDIPSGRTCNWNQFYSKITQRVGVSGCSWTCALDVANIYGPSAYEPEDMPSSAWVNGACQWILPSGCIGAVNNYTSGVRPWTFYNVHNSNQWNGLDIS